MQQLIRKSIQTKPSIVRRRPSAARSGMTLLEILLAGAILAIAIAALEQQTYVGVQASLRSQMQSEAATRARSVMHQLQAGILPMESSPFIPLDDDQRWLCSVTVDRHPQLGLKRLVVRVRRATSPDGDFELTRLVSPHDSDQTTGGHGPSQSHSRFRSTGRGGFQGLLQ